MPKERDPFLDLSPPEPRFPKFSGTQSFPHPRSPQDSLWLEPVGQFLHCGPSAPETPALEGPWEGGRLDPQAGPQGRGGGLCL